MSSYHYWIKGARRCSLSARMHVESSNTANVWFCVPAEDSFLYKVEQWCISHKCGRRVQYDTFIFKNNKHKMLFLLCWG